MISPILFIFICSVVELNALEEVKSVSISDSPVLVKILQSVDAATSDEHLYDITLRLLKSLCVCMRETLAEKKNNILSDTNSLEADTNSPEADSKSRTSDLKVNLYMRIYNSTCINLHQDLLHNIKRPRNITSDIEDGTLLQSTNCGKKIVNELDIEISNSQQVNKDGEKLRLRNILYRTLIKTRKFHKYTIKTSSLFRKAKAHVSKLKRSVIIIVTLHLFNKTIQDFVAIEEKELNDTINSNTIVDIDIIDTNYDFNEKESQERANSEMALECHLHSIYAFLVECENRNLTKIFKLLRKNGTIKIYIDVTTSRNHTDYSSMCCNNSNVSVCNVFEIAEESTTELFSYYNQSNLFEKGHYKDTINKLKELVKLYNNKINEDDKYNISKKLSEEDLTVKDTHDNNTGTLHNFYEISSEHVHNMTNNISKISSITSQLQEMTKSFPLNQNLNPTSTQFSNVFKTQNYTIHSEINKTSTEASTSSQIKPYKDLNMITSNNIIDIVKVTVAKKPTPHNQKQYRNFNAMENYKFKLSENTATPSSRNKTENEKVNMDTEIAIYLHMSTDILNTKKIEDMRFEDTKFLDALKSSKTNQHTKDYLVPQTDRSILTFNDDINRSHATKMPITKHHYTDADVKNIDKATQNNMNITNPIVNLKFITSANKDVDVTTGKKYDAQIYDTEYDKDMNGSNDHVTSDKISFLEVNKLPKSVLTTQTPPPKNTESIHISNNDKIGEKTFDKKDYMTHKLQDITTESWDSSFSQKSTRSMRDSVHSPDQITTSLMPDQINTQLTDNTGITWNSLAYINLPSTLPATKSPIRWNVKEEQSQTDFISPDSSENVINNKHERVPETTINIFNFNNLNTEKVCYNSSKSVNTDYNIEGATVHTSTDKTNVIDKSIPNKYVNNNNQKIFDVLRNPVLEMYEKNMAFSSEYSKLSEQTTPYIKSTTVDNVTITENITFTETNKKILKTKFQLHLSTNASFTKRTETTHPFTSELKNRKLLFNTTISPQGRMTYFSVPKSIDQETDDGSKKNSISPESLSKNLSPNELNKNKKTTATENYQRSKGNNASISLRPVVKIVRTTKSELQVKNMTTISEFSNTYTSNNIIPNSLNYFKLPFTIDHKFTLLNSAALTKPYKTEMTKSVTNSEYTTKKLLFDENNYNKKINIGNRNKTDNEDLTTSAPMVSYLNNLSQNIHSSENTIPFYEKTTKSNERYSGLIRLNLISKPELWLKDTHYVNSKLTTTTENDNVTKMTTFSFMAQKPSGLPSFDQNITESTLPLTRLGTTYAQYGTFTESSTMRSNSKPESEATPSFIKSINYDRNASFQSTQSECKFKLTNVDVNSKITDNTPTKAINLISTSKPLYTVLPKLFTKTTIPHKNKLTIMPDELIAKVTTYPQLINSTTKIQQIEKPTLLRDKHEESNVKTSIYGKYLTGGVDRYISESFTEKFYGEKSTSILGEATNDSKSFVVSENSTDMITLATNTINIFYAEPVEMNTSKVSTSNSIISHGDKQSTNNQPHSKPTTSTLTHFEKTTAIKNVTEIYKTAHFNRLATSQKSIENLYTILVDKSTESGIDTAHKSKTKLKNKTTSIHSIPKYSTEKASIDNLKVKVLTTKPYIITSRKSITNSKINKNSTTSEIRLASFAIPTINNIKISKYIDKNTYKTKIEPIMSNITIKPNNINKQNKIFDKYQNIKIAVTRSTTATYSDWLKKRFLVKYLSPAQNTTNLRKIIYNTYQPTTEEDLDFSSELDTLKGFKKLHTIKEISRMQSTPMLMKSYKPPMNFKSLQSELIKPSTNYYNEFRTTKIENQSDDKSKYKRTTKEDHDLMIKFETSKSLKAVYTNKEISRTQNIPMSTSSIKNPTNIKLLQLEPELKTFKTRTSSYNESSTTKMEKQLKVNNRENNALTNYIKKTYKPTTSEEPEYHTTLISFQKVHTTKETSTAKSTPLLTKSYKAPTNFNLIQPETITDSSYNTKVEKQLKVTNTENDVLANYYSSTSKQTLSEDPDFSSESEMLIGVKKIDTNKKTPRTPTKSYKASTNFNSLKSELFKPSTSAYNESSTTKVEKHFNASNTGNNLLVNYSKNTYKRTTKDDHDLMIEFEKSKSSKTVETHNELSRTQNIPMSTYTHINSNKAATNLKLLLPKPELKTFKTRTSSYNESSSTKMEKQLKVNSREKNIQTDYNKNTCKQTTPEKPDSSSEYTALISFKKVHTTKEISTAKSIPMLTKSFKALINFNLVQPETITDNTSSKNTKMEKQLKIINTENDILANYYRSTYKTTIPEEPDISSETGMPIDLKKEDIIIETSTTKSKLVPTKSYKAPTYFIVLQPEPFIASTSSYNEASTSKIEHKFNASNIVDNVQVKYNKIKYKPTIIEQFDLLSEYDKRRRFEKLHTDTEISRTRSIPMTTRVNTKSYKTTTKFKELQAESVLKTLKASTSSYNEPSITKIGNQIKANNTNSYKKQSSNKKKLLAPFEKTNLYPIKIVSTKTQRKLLKRIQLSNQRKEIMTMNTQDFFSRRFVTQRNIIKYPSVYSLPAKYRPVTIIPLHLLQPKLVTIEKPIQIEHYRPKPLFIKSDLDFSGEKINFHKLLRPTVSKWREKVGFLQTQNEDRPILKEMIIEKPSFVLKANPEHYRIRTETSSKRPTHIRKYFLRNKHKNSEEVGLPTFHFRLTNFKYGVPTIRPTTENVRRKRRTIFFLSPTKPYNRYF